MTGRRGSGLVCAVAGKALNAFIAIFIELIARFICCDSSSAKDKAKKEKKKIIYGTLNVYLFIYTILQSVFYLKCLYELV